jgi:MFS family permease
VGGLLTDYMARRDIRWYAWMPALVCALGAPIYWLALTAHQLWTFVAIDFLAELILAIGMSVCFVAIHAVCGTRRRTMAIAIAQLSFVLIGSGFGPLMAGALSDMFRSTYGLQSLRHSLIAMVAFLLPAAFAFYRAGLTIPGDLETC